MSDGDQESKSRKSPHRDDLVLLQIFGCQMNKLDGELIRSRLHESGYSFTDDLEQAGIVLFLTCSVREHAESRVHSRLGALKAWKMKHPEKIIGLMGCMAQKDGEALLKRHPHLDLVVGTRDFPWLPEYLEAVRSGRRGLVALDREERPEVLRNESLRPHPFKAYLAVMRGCEMRCAYCVVPYVRGRESSRSMEKVVEEAERLCADGVKEITLLGQTVNRYRDDQGHGLAQLITRLDGLPGLKRLGFITSYPAFMNDELIKAMADCSVLSHYLHLPAQSGSDRILKKMRRRYTAGAYRETVSRLRETIPDIELGADFIVGFPGEEDEDFQQTKALFESVRFQQAFIFKYSTRPGTRAAEDFEDDVPEAVKKARNAELLALQETIGAEKNAAYVGREVEVLVEGISPRDSSRYVGRTIHNQIVAFPGEPDWIGRLVRIRVEEATALTMIGTANGKAAPHG
ncbi:MAG: tRNA (N6-isopentenyl adenosine(37)-C2)-methylthiotransferase MiaB [Planctomycetes bacterium]|nr:tRNA (N6-isopentenyl adenosine(37)-C2)-methylthiotransferase MiaB [Planctomycetota bacterium]